MFNGGLPRRESVSLGHQEGEQDDGQGRLRHFHPPPLGQRHLSLYWNRKVSALHIINQRKVKAAGVGRQIEESPLLDSLFGESVESEVEARFDFGGKNDNQHLYPVCTPDLEGKVKDRLESKQAIYQ